MSVSRLPVSCRFASVIAFLWALGCPEPLAAQTQQTPNTWQLEEGSSPVAASLAEFSWMLGHWAGSGLGGECEEWWMPPAGGRMLGMFRAIRSDELIFSEFFSLHDQDGGLVLRLRHFDRDFVGWEEKDRPVDFPLISVEPGLARFSGLTYRLLDENQLQAFVAVKNKDGEHKELTFHYHRVPPQGD